MTADRGNERALWLALNVLPYEKALRSWLCGKFGAAIEIDDIVQDTYAALSALESVDHIRNPRSYAFRTAYSLITAQFDRARVVSIRPVPDHELDKMLGDAPTPEQIAEGREELHNVSHVLAQLPQNVREVFLLRRLQGLSQRQIAALLGISENTVEKRVSKGIRLLAEVFGRGGKEAAKPLPSDQTIHAADRASRETRGNEKKLLGLIRGQDRRK